MNLPKPLTLADYTKPELMIPQLTTHSIVSVMQELGKFASQSLCLLRESRLRPLRPAACQKHLRTLQRCQPGRDGLHDLLRDWKAG